MTLSITRAEDALLAELAAAIDDVDGLTEAEYTEPSQFADAVLNNLPAIAYALHAGYPAIAWQGARKNPGETDQVLRAMRQWSEQARGLLVALVAGAISLEFFYAAMVKAFERHSRNAYLAGRRAMGKMAPLTAQQELALLAALDSDQVRLDAFLRQPEVAGGIGSMLLAMVTDPTNYLGSGLPGDPFAGLPPPLGAGKHDHAPAKQMGRYGQRIEQYAGAVGSMSHQGELDALADIPGDAVMVWWTLGAADHCVDCIALSDASPFYASALGGNGIYPGSGHTRCGANCACALQYDVPSEVCTDLFQGPGSLGDLLESADGRRLNVWIMEAAACRNPAPVESFAPVAADETILGDEQAYSWDQDVTAAIAATRHFTYRDLQDAIARHVAGEPALSPVADPGAFARAFAWLESVMPARALPDVRFTRYELDGTVYHAASTRTSQAIRFEVGHTTTGLPVLDGEFTLKAIHDLADEARAAGLRLEVNGATASEGMAGWLDALGARRYEGRALPTVKPDFAQQGELARRGIGPLAEPVPDFPGLATARAEYIDARASIANAPTEHTVLVTPDGRLLRGEGDTGGAAVAKEGEGALVLHNHPRDHTFSATDLMGPSRYGWAQMEVVSGDTLYRALPGPNGWPDAERVRQAYAGAVDRVASRIDAMPKAQADEALDHLSTLNYNEAVRQLEADGYLQHETLSLAPPHAGVAPTPSFMLPEVDALPSWPEMGLLKADTPRAVKALGGFSLNKQILIDPAGGRWLFKAENPAAEAGAAAIGQALGLRIPPMRLVTWEGREGTLQPIIEGARSLESGRKLGSITAEQLDAAGMRELARESVLDFVVGNVDSHAGNFVLDQAGALWGVDRGRSFIGAVATSRSAEGFFVPPDGAERVFGAAVDFPARSKVWKSITPADVGQVLDRLDGLTATEFEQLAGGAIDLVVSPFGSREQKLDAILERKAIAREEFGKWFRRAIDERAKPSDLSSEWQTWRKAGGTFEAHPVAAMAAPERLLPEAPAAIPLPGPYVANVASAGTAGNDVATWSAAFVAAKDKATVLQRLDEVLAGTSANILGGFNLAQLNTILARAETMRDMGVDLTIVKRLGDFSRVPAADRVGAIGLTYKDRIALADRHEWAYLAGKDSPDTVYNDIGGLFAHEYGHVAFGKMGSGAQGKMIALYKANADDAVRDLSSYADTDLHEWVGEVMSAVTAPGYVRGSLAYDEEFWTILAADGKVLAPGVDGVPAATTHQPKPEVKPKKPTEPVGPPIPEADNAWLPGDAQQYMAGGSDLPLNTPLTDWTGYVPPEPALPPLGSTPETRAAAKAARDAVTRDWHDVADGSTPLAFSWTAAEGKAAKKAGLVEVKVGDQWVVAKGQEDLKPLLDYIEAGGKSSDDAFWHLMGYSDADLAVYDLYDQLPRSLRLTGGVVMVEPDGRMWVLAPKNKFAGYENTWIKGGVDKGETAAQAAVREVLEESGFSVELDAYLGDYINSDKTGIARMYVGHRTGGGPLWAHEKETYKVKLLTGDDTRKALTRYGKPDARDQAILDDAVAALAGKPGAPVLTIGVEDLPEFAAKTSPAGPMLGPGAHLDRPSVLSPHAGIAPTPGNDPPLATAFGYDHDLIKSLYGSQTETPPAAKFPYFQTRWKMPDGTAQAMYWQEDLVNHRLFWANSKKQVVDPHLRFTLHVAQLQRMGEAIAADPTLAYMRVNEALLAQVPKLREMLMAAGGKSVGTFVDIGRDDMLALIEGIKAAGPLPKAPGLIPTAPLVAEHKIELDGLDQGGLLKVLDSLAYASNPVTPNAQHSFWVKVGGQSHEVTWTWADERLKFWTHPEDTADGELLLAAAATHLAPKAKELGVPLQWSATWADTDSWGAVLHTLGGKLGPHEYGWDFDQAALDAWSAKLKAGLAADGHVATALDGPGHPLPTPFDAPTPAPIAAVSPEPGPGEVAMTSAHGQDLLAIMGMGKDVKATIDGYALTVTEYIPGQAVTWRRLGNDLYTHHTTTSLTEPFFEAHILRLAKLADESPKVASARFLYASLLDSPAGSAITDMLKKAGASEYQAGLKLTRAQLLDLRDQIVGAGKAATAAPTTGKAGLAEAVKRASEQTIFIAPQGASSWADLMDHLYPLDKGQPGQLLWQDAVPGGKIKVFAIYDAKGEAAAIAEVGFAHAADLNAERVINVRTRAGLEGKGWAKALYDAIQDKTAYNLYTGVAQSNTEAGHAFITKWLAHRQALAGGPAPITFGQAYKVDMAQAGVLSPSIGTFAKRGDQYTYQINGWPVNVIHSQQGAVLTIALIQATSVPKDTLPALVAHLDVLASKFESHPELQILVVNEIALLQNPTLGKILLDAGGSSLGKDIAITADKLLALRDSLLPELGHGPFAAAAKAIPTPEAGGIHALAGATPADVQAALAATPDMTTLGSLNYSRTWAGNVNTYWQMSNAPDTGASILTWSTTSYGGGTAAQAGAAVLAQLRSFADAGQAGAFEKMYIGKYALPDDLRNALIAAGAEVQGSFIVVDEGLTGAILGAIDHGTPLPVMADLMLPITPASAGATLSAQLGYLPGDIGSLTTTSTPMNQPLGTLTMHHPTAPDMEVQWAVAGQEQVIGILPEVPYNLNGAAVQVEAVMQLTVVAQAKGISLYIPTEGLNDNVAHALAGAGASQEGKVWVLDPAAIDKYQAAVVSDTAMNPLTWGSPTAPIPFPEHETVLAPSLPVAAAEPVATGLIHDYGFDPVIYAGLGGPTIETQAQHFSKLIYGATPGGEPTIVKIRESASTLRWVSVSGNPNTRMEAGLEVLVGTFRDQVDALPSIKWLHFDAIDQMPAQWKDLLDALAGGVTTPGELGGRIALTREQFLNLSDKLKADLAAGASGAAYVPPLGKLASAWSDTLGNHSLSWLDSAGGHIGYIDYEVKANGKDVYLTGISKDMPVADKQAAMATVAANLLPNQELLVYDEVAMDSAFAKLFTHEELHTFETVNPDDVLDLWKASMETPPAPLVMGAETKPKLLATIDVEAVNALSAKTWSTGKLPISTGLAIGSTSKGSYQWRSLSSVVTLDGIYAWHAAEPGPFVAKALHLTADKAMTLGKKLFVSDEVLAHNHELADAIQAYSHGGKVTQSGMTGSLFTQRDVAQLKHALDGELGVVATAEPWPGAATVTPTVAPSAPIAAAVPPAPIPPPPTSLAGLYGYSPTAVKMPQPAMALTYESKSAKSWLDTYPSGVTTAWGEMVQGHARILQVRTISGGTSGLTGQADAFVASLTGRWREYMAEHPELERFRVEKKAIALQPHLGQLLTDAGFKETKDYYVIGRAEFDTFAAELAGDSASWAKTPAIAQTVPAQPLPTPALPTKGAEIEVGVEVAPIMPTGASASPSFIYGYGKGQTDAAKAGLVDQALAPDAKGAAPHNLRATNGMTAGWSASPSGKTVGWSALVVPAGLSSQAKVDTAFGMLRKILDDASGRSDKFWVRPDVYDQVPGMRQILLDAGGGEYSFPAIGGTAIQMTTTQAAVLAKALESDVMTGLTIGTKDIAGYLGFDPNALAHALDASPNVGNGRFEWAIGGKKPSMVLGLSKDGRVAHWTGVSQGDETTRALAAMAQLNWLSENGVTELTVDFKAYAAIPKFDKFLMGAGAKVEGTSLHLDADAINSARKYIVRDQLPVLLGGDKLPFSIADEMIAKGSEVMAAIHTEAISTGLVTRATFEATTGARITMTYTKSTSNVFWSSIDRGGANVGQARAAAVAQLHSFVDQIAQGAGLSRLDVGLEVLADQPGLRAVLKKYGAKEIAPTSKSPAYLTLNRDQVLKLRKDLDAELAALAPAGATGTYIGQQAALIVWPTADEMTPYLSVAQAQAKYGGQTPKAIFRDKAGNEWLFKPGESGRGAATDQAAASLALALGLNVPPVRTYSLVVDGKLTTGSLQKMLPRAKSMKEAGIMSPAAMNPEQTAELFRHSILDWVIANDDAHMGNWLLDENGKLWSIDKSRGWESFGGRQDVLSTASNGNGGGTPWLFQFFRDAKRDPRILSKLTPQDLAPVLRKLRDLSDADFLRLVEPVAPLTRNRKYAGAAKQMTTDMLKRKREAATDFERYIGGEIRALMADPIAKVGVPKQWSDWLRSGGHFNLDATPRDLSLERMGVLDARFGEFSAARAQELYRQSHLRPILSEITSYFSHPLAGAKSGTYGAELIRPKLLRQKMDAKLQEWQELTEWAMLHVVNGGASPAGATTDALIRRFWDPEKATFRLVRTTDRYGRSPQAYIAGYTKDGMRDMVGTALGRVTTVAGGGGVILYIEVPANQVFSSFIFGHGVGRENEFLVIDPRLDQIIGIVTAGSDHKLPFDKLMDYSGPVIVA